MSLGKNRAGIERLLARETELIHLANLANLANLECDEAVPRREQLVRQPTAEGLLRQPDVEGSARWSVVQKKTPLPQT